MGLKRLYRTLTRAGRRLFRSSRRHWRHVPVLVRLEASGLACAVVAAAIVPWMAGHGGFEKAAFAVPARDGPALLWKEEVAGFADRMQEVFGVDRKVAREFSGWILEAARRHHLSPELLASLVFTESSFRKNVVSHVGAIGPAQVRPYWAPFCGNSNLTDPAENIYCGAQILSHFRDRCGSERCALRAYNIGLHERDDEMLRAGHRYVAKIDRHLQRFNNTTL